jgi:NUMOD3 motif
VQHADSFREFYVYLHCKPDGTPFYVGKATVNPKNRSRRTHMFSHRSGAHKSIVGLYGASQIKVFVFPCASEKEALADERQHIAQLRKDGAPLVNITSGGQGMCGTKQSPETLAKLSLSRTGRKISEETRARLSIAQKARTDRKPRTAEHTAKIVASRTGKKQGPHSAEHRARLSAAHKGKIGHIPNAETRRKMSEALRGRVMPAGALQKAWVTRRANAQKGN